ncbi:MAG: PrpF domain-containing protein, partial [Burkholderiales bacterium]
TVAHRMSKLSERIPERVRIEHPSGIIEVEIAASTSGGAFELREANVLRTCRKLFEGQICIPSRIWDGRNKARDAAQLAAA